MKIRSFLFWCHLAAGITAGSIILLMCVTGVLLTYERQMIAWSDSHLQSAPSSAGAERLPVSALLERLRARQPGIEVAAVSIAARAEAPVTVDTAQGSLYADAYSGRILGEPSQGVRQFMAGLRAWHRWLAAEGDGRTAARAVTGWSNVVFLLIIVSGLYLWLPRQWTGRHLKPILLFQGGLRGKARDFNWHNVIGIWSAVVLFIVVASAVPISFPWGTALLYRMAGEELPPPRAGRGGGSRGGASAGAAESLEARDAPDVFAGLDAHWASAKRRVPDWQTITLRAPASLDAPVVFAIDAGEGGQPQLRSTLTLDRTTAQVVSYEAFGDQSSGRRLRSLARFAHTGEVLGIAGQTVAGAVTAGGAVLVWTGVALAWRRLRAWQKRRVRATAAEPATSS